MSEGGFQKMCNMIKYVYSTCLLIFSLVIVMGLIFSRQTALSSQVHPALAFVVIWVVLLWLSVVEGGQASLVGLSPVEPELYKESHPKAYLSTKVAHRGDNLDRYLLGRQFMVIFIVFIINYCGAPLAGAQLWGLPDIIITLFLTTGLAMIFFTAMVGQLQSQVNASLCMLDYFNDYVNCFTFWVAMIIEGTGLVHASYLIAMIVGLMAGKPHEWKEGPMTGMKLILFWVRVLISLAILGTCFAVTLSALFQGKTTMWGSVPNWAAVILFFLLMSCVGMLEGMQIAFFAVAKIPKSERGSSKFAQMTCDLLFKGDGRNLPGFMIGRQLSVVSCFFIIARVTTINVVVGVDENIFGVSDAIQNFFNTGLCGAFITTIVASVAWQLVAAAFPIAFLSNPFTYIFLRICLFFEATGLCSGAWVIAAVDKKVRGFQRDEVYIGTAEERAAKDNADDDERVIMGPGHITKLPGFVEDAPQNLKDLMKSDPSVREYVSSMHGDKPYQVEETDHDVESN